MLPVVAAGVVLRFLATSPLWLDEAQSAAISQLPLPSLLAALRGDAAPPLYYLLLHLWMRLGGTGDWWVRSLSGLFAAAALPLFYRVGERHGAGLMTLALAAANPWLVRYATEARPYALEVLLVLLGAVALEAVYRRPGPGRAAVLAVVSGLLLLTHYWSLFLYAAVGVGLLVALARTRSRPAGWSLAGLAGGSLFFLPWIPTFWYQTGHTGTPWAGRSGVQTMPAVIGDWVAGDAAAASALLLVAWPLIVWAALTGRRRTRLLAAAGAVTLLLGFAVAAVTDSPVTGRYTAVVVPVALLLLGAGVAMLPRPWSAVVVIGLVVSWLPADAWQATESRTKAAAIAAVLNRELSADDTVVFCPDQLAPDVVRRLRADPRLFSFPDQDWPGRLDWSDYARRIETESVAGLAARVASGRGDGTVWLVPAYGFRPFGDRCDALRVALESALGRGGQVPTGAPGRSFTLWRW